MYIILYYDIIFMKYNNLESFIINNKIFANYNAKILLF